MTDGNQPHSAHDVPDRRRGFSPARRAAASFILAVLDGLAIWRSHKKEPEHDPY